MTFTAGPSGISRSLVLTTGLSSATSPSVLSGSISPTGTTPLTTNTANLSTITSSGIVSGVSDSILRSTTASPPYPAWNSTGSLPFDTTCTETTIPPPHTTPGNHTTTTRHKTTVHMTRTSKHFIPTSSCNETTFVTVVSKVSRVSSRWRNATLETRHSTGTAPVLSTFTMDTSYTIGPESSSSELSSSTTGSPMAFSTASVIDPGRGPLDHHHTHSDLDVAATAGPK
ncbi:hypothetical protein B0H63DRAFT_457512 [Podospora didyma]|uniref:Uncharacterized protein n=1 Tax=Podospora didyma TaxID=330526 RepID=A0AAE0P4H6_9PEZI|nr:hypothetical protein B0H63DRAFT_457512 [Podospora didyma]